VTVGILLKLSVTRKRFLAVTILVAIGAFLLLRYVGQYFSLENRLVRFSSFTDIFASMSLFENLFGVGFLNTNYSLEMNFSMGLAQMVFEVGIICSMLVLLMVFALSHMNWRVVVVVMLGLLVFEVTKLPLFWVALVLAGTSTRLRTRVEPQPSASQSMKPNSVTL
jgi:hypothetical protein